MKVKVVLKKGAKNNRITRILNIDNQSHSKTAQSSLKDLTKALANNEEPKIINNNKNNHKLDSKTKYNKILIKAKEKSLNKDLSKTVENQSISKDNQIKQVNNLLQEKGKKIRSDNSFSGINSKKYKLNKISNNNVFDKKIYYKTPIRIRDIATQNKNINYDSKFNKQYLNEVYFNNIEKNNSTISIMNLQKELDSLKKENSYKTMLINNMKQQIEEFQKNQLIMKENNLLKEQIRLLKIKFNDNNINENNKKINNNKEFEDLDLFDKLKFEYFNNQNQLNELKNENAELKYILNKNYITKSNQINKDKINNENKIIKNIEINLKGKINQEKINKKDDINSYIENKYKLILLKNNENINNFYKPLKEAQKEEIRFLIKMTLNSNNISKEKLLNIIFNNLTNFNDIINSFINDFLKVNSLLDKSLLKHYFTVICSREKNKIEGLNINNLFSEINYYYNDEQNKYNEQKISQIFSNNANIKQLNEKCKFKDTYNTGIIELKHFNEIFIEIYGNFINNEKNKELYNLFIYAMKNYSNLKDLGLYYLNYQNLNYDNYKKNLQNIKNINIIENEYLGQNESEDASNLKNNNSSNNSEFGSNRSNKYLITSNKKISNEDIVANVSINVDHSTALVNVKFKNHYDSENESDSNIQTSIKDINSGKSKKINENSHDFNKENNKIFIPNNNYQICIDFVSNIFDYCLKKLERDRRSIYKILEDSI